MIVLFGPLIPKVDVPDFSEERKKAEEAARRARAEAAARAGRAASIITGEADLSKLGGRPSILGGGR
jgi:hypothetical protein